LLHDETGQEAAMCHAVRVRLSPAEAKEARKLAGMLMPVYACVALLALAVVALSSAPRPGEQVAVASNTAPVQPSVDRAKSAVRTQD
jgi:hypothetical protein